MARGHLRAWPIQVRGSSPSFLLLLIVMFTAVFVVSFSLPEKNTALCERLASRGYVVFAIYNDDIDKAPPGMPLVLFHR